VNEQFAAEILAAVRAMDKKLTDHMEGEEGTIDAIQHNIERIERIMGNNREYFEQRHDAAATETKRLADLLEASMRAQEKCAASITDVEAIKTAFVLDDLKRPDYNGHRLDHKNRIESAAETHGDMRKVLLAVVISLTLTAGGWIWTAAKTAAMADLVAEHQEQGRKR
jgi:hypothetical protein